MVDNTPTPIIQPFDTGEHEIGTPLIPESHKIYCEKIDIYPNIVNTTNDILKWIYDSLIDTFVLKAQPMSGKTDTMLLLAYILLAYKKVDEVYFVTAMSDTDIKNQYTRDIKSFSAKYKKYILYTIDKTTDDWIDRISYIDSLPDKIHCVTGTQLKKRYNIDKSLVFIDESDHGQSLTQMLNKFCKNHQLFTNKERQVNDNILCSVSATCFSEEINVIQHEQNDKKIIKMNPGIGYVSIKGLYENKSIKFIPENDLKRRIRLIIRNRQNIPGTAIIRVTNVTAKVCQKICDEEKKNYKCYDMNCNEDINHVISKVPIIFVKNRLRRGQRIDKKYIRCLVETCGKSKSDTFIQAFLGRACGYPTNPQQNAKLNIEIYLIDNPKYKEWIEDYTEDRILDNANNVLREKRSTKKLYPTIPGYFEMHISKSFERSTDDLKYLIRQEILLRIRSSGKNTDDKHITYLLENHGTECIIFCNLDNDTYIGFEDKLKFHYDNKLPMIEPGTSCGLASGGNEIKCWFPKNYHKTVSSPEETIEFYLHYLGHKRTTVPKTTGREIFNPDNPDNYLESADDNNDRGVYTIQLGPLTTYDPKRMRDELSKIITFDLETGGSNQITSKSKGNEILLSPAVCKSLEVNGETYKYLNTKLNCKLKVNKKRGRIRKEYDIKGCFPVKSISWTF